MQSDIVYKDHSRIHNQGRIYGMASGVGWRIHRMTSGFGAYLGMASGVGAYSQDDFGFWVAYSRDGFGCPSHPNILKKKKIFHLSHNS